MSGQTFYTVAVGIAGGIFLRSIFDIPISFVVALFVIGTALFLLWYGGKESRDHRIFLLAMVFVCGAFGMSRFDISTWNEKDSVFENYVGAKVTVEGVIVREVDERADSTQLIVHIESIGGESVDRRVLIRTDRFPEFEYGDRVRAKGKLEHPEAFETNQGRTFDYPGYLSVRGITYILSRSQVAKIGDDEGNAVLAFLLSVKHAFMKRIESVLPEPQAGLAEGLVLGVKRALGEDLENAFRTAGVIHIIVLSGYNVAILVEAVMRLLFFMRLRTRVVLGAVIICAFALVAGLSATVVRASLMAVLVLLSRAMGRRYDILRALIFAGLAMLLFNPKLLVFDPGFQLSFLATLGLILGVPLLEKKMAMISTKFQIRELFVSTLSTQILVLPLLLYAMGLFSVIALPANLLILPFVPLTMLLIFISGTLAFVSHILALPVAFGAHLLLSYIITVVEYATALPFAGFSVPAFPFWVVVLAYAIVGTFLGYLYRKQNHS